MCSEANDRPAWQVCERGAHLLATDETLEVPQWLKKGRQALGPMARLWVIGHWAS